MGWRVCRLPRRPLDAIAWPPARIVDPSETGSAAACVCDDVWCVAALKLTAETEAAEPAHRVERRYPDVGRREQT